MSSTADTDGKALGVAEQAQKTEIPRHIAIIMDGNGRWAEAQGLPRIQGHERGAHVVHEIVNECCEIAGIKQLTLFAFSIENWKRPKHEVAFIMHLLKNFMAEQKKHIVQKNVQLKIVGDLDGLPKGARDSVQDVLDATENNTGLVLALAVNYGGRQEIANAAQEIAREVLAGKLAIKDIDMACVEEHLWSRGMPNPDLLIRTAGEMRLSNFLLWQCSYAEFYVTSVCWPEFNTEHLHRAIKTYARRVRKFGGLQA